MTFLASLLPGVRELRTPLTCGYILLCSAWVTTTFGPLSLNFSKLRIFLPSICMLHGPRPSFWVLRRYPHIFLASSLRTSAIAFRALSSQLLAPTCGLLDSCFSSSQPIKP